MQTVTGLLPLSTGSTAFRFPCDSSIRGSHLNSLHHPIHACAHSRLDSCGVGSVVGVGVGVCVCLVSFLLVLLMMWMMPAWMDLSLI